MPLMLLDRRLPLASVVLGVALVLSACGGGSPDAQSEVPSDTLIRPMEREPLTEADMAGIAMTELALELPWTQNRVSRDVAVGVPAVALHSAEVVGHDGFDRVTFTTGGALAETGYEITLEPAGATVGCGTDSHELTAERTLVVRFGPARASEGDERWIALGLQDTNGSRMARSGVLCDEGGTVVWTSELAGGDQVRVLELREPGRIAVDVR